MSLASLNTTEYTQITTNSDKLIVQDRSTSGIRLHIGDTTPLNSTDDYFTISHKGMNLAGLTGKNVYVRGNNGAALCVYVAL